jgi:hypothetical protein
MKATNNKTKSTKHFDQIVAALKTGPLLDPNNLPADVPNRSLVAFYSGGKLVYIGATRAVRRYINNTCFHTRSFLVLKLARLATGFTKPVYNGGPRSLSALRNNPLFKAALIRMAAYVANSKVRVAGIAEDSKLEVFHKTVQVILKSSCHSSVQ